MHTFKEVGSCIQQIHIKAVECKDWYRITSCSLRGEGTLYHYGSVICNDKVKAGTFVTIQSDVNISENVTIGDNVYLATGAKVLANVKIADGVIIGANAVVTKSINEAYTSWAGIPAKK